MGLSQMAALTGRKYQKRPYGAEINAQLRYLPAMVGQRKTEEHRGRMYGLGKQGLEQNKDLLDAQKKAAKRANLLGYANIGLGAGLSGYGLMQDSGKEAAKSATETFDPSIFSEFSTGEGDGGFEMESNWYNQIPGMKGVSNVASKLWGGAADVGQNIYDSIAGSFFDVDFDADIDWASEFSGMY